LISHFISAFEIDNYPVSKFAEWLGAAHDDRSRLFLEIAEPCYNNYKQALRDKDYIDFQDMINGAVNVLDGFIKEGKKSSI
jgi:superfamily I DNA/RNA helicase